MRKRNKKQQSGQLIIIAFLFLAILLTMSTALIGYTVLQVRGQRQAYYQGQALDLAEAGVDEAISQLNQGSGYTGETTTFGPGVFSVTVTTIDSNDKQIISTGYVPNNTSPLETKTVKTLVNINSSSISFNLGVQVGAGGLQMNNGSQVSGNVYSNGNITGSGTINGTAIVAGGIESSPDQQWTTQNTDFKFGDSTADADVAQSFVPAISKTLAKVGVYIKKVGSPTDLTVQILNDNNGVPSKTVVATGTISASTVAGSYGFIDGTFSTTPTLLAGQKYWLMLISAVNASNYFYWGLDNTDAYASGTGMYSANWNATTPVWASAGGDFDFQVFLGTANTYLSGVTVGSDLRAHSIQTCSVGGNAYFSQTNTCTVTGNAYSNQTDMPPQAMPISQAEISEWEQSATAGGVIAGPYTISGTQTLGPKEINGNLTINGTLNMTGPVWVKGNLVFANGSHLTIDPSLGNLGTMIMADDPSNLSTSGIITVNNNVVFTGDGNPNSTPLVISTNSGTSAISINNNANGAVFYTSNGTILVSNNVQANQLAGYAVSLANNAIITYTSGLASSSFASGPGGSWQYNPGTYVILK